MAYGYCVWCGNKMEKNRGRPKLHCSKDCLARYRTYKYRMSKNVPMRWRDDSEKARFYAAQRRMRLSDDIFSTVNKELHSMVNPDIATAQELKDQEPKVEPVASEPQVTETAPQEQEEPQPEQQKQLGELLDELKTALTKAIIRPAEPIPQKVPAETIFRRIIVVDSRLKTRTLHFQYPPFIVKEGDVLRVTVQRVAKIDIEEHY